MDEVFGSRDSVANFTEVETCPPGSALPDLNLFASIIAISKSPAI
jgi:hypothetical protein